MRGGGEGIRRQQIHSSILAFPPVHNNLRIYSIALLSFIINTESHPTDSTHIRSHTKPPCTLVCTHKHTLTHTFFYPGQAHCMCLMGQYMWCVMWLTAPLPCCPAFKPSSSSGCLSPGVDCIFYLSFSLPWLYLPQLAKKEKKKILRRKLQSA